MSNITTTPSRPDPQLDPTPKRITAMTYSNISEDLDGMNLDEALMALAEEMHSMERNARNALDPDCRDLDLQWDTRLRWHDDEGNGCRLDITVSRLETPDEVERRIREREKRLIELADARVATARRDVEQLRRNVRTAEELLTTRKTQLEAAERLIAEVEAKAENVLAERMVAENAAKEGQ